MALLALEHVSKAFWRGQHRIVVLDDVSLEVNAGDFVAVYGRRSAGKTTLLKVAAGLELPDAGRVLVDGVDLAGLSMHRLAHVHRDRVVWVRRSGPATSELRMLDYVALPLAATHSRRAAHERARLALADVGVESCALERWTSLSDVERVLVSIAHALVRSPEVVLVDDPTAGLDVVERERILSRLRRAADADRVGVLMVVPDMPSMLRAHDVLSLSDGRLLGPAGPERRGATVIEFPAGEQRA